MKCANHPLNEAASYCGQCGRALCAECKREVSGTVYCENCLAGRLRSPLPPWGGVGAGPSPGVALALGFIPGVGAIYNGQITKAISQVLIFGCLIALDDRVHGGMDVFFGLAASAFYFYMVIDSYQTAKAKSMGKPVPDIFGLGEIKVNAPVGAALLIGLGALFLLDNLGVPVINQLGKFWPVLLIVGGFLLLQRRLGGGSDSPPLPPETRSLPEKPPEGPGNMPGGKLL
jgi:hypothetical protein